jgi:pyrroloquinoline quinone (PQQ) biosynthesis protein C
MIRAPAAPESRLLRGKIELVLPMLLSAGERLFKHPRIRELYPEYLFVSHCIVRASVPLMRTARERATELAGDRVASIAADYLGRHIDEELGHDEWLLEDMAAIGIDRDRVLERPPPPTIASLVGAQYYWIRHYHPVGLFGYIALLEGYPPRDEDVAAVRARTGFPSEAFRTLSMHAELDPHHGQELDEVVDSLPLTPSQRTVLGLSAISSVQLLTRAIEELIVE